MWYEPMTPHDFSRRAAADWKLAPHDIGTSARRGLAAVWTSVSARALSRRSNGRPPVRWEIGAECHRRSGATIFV